MSLDDRIASARAELDARPDDAGAAYRLATLLDRAGRRKEAFERYERAVALHPDGPAAGPFARAIVERMREADRFASSSRFTVLAKGRRKLGALLRRSGYLALTAFVSLTAVRVLVPMGDLGETLYSIAVGVALPACCIVVAAVVLASRNILCLIDRRLQHAFVLRESRGRASALLDVRPFADLALRRTRVSEHDPRAYPFHLAVLDKYEIPAYLPLPGVAGERILATQRELLGPESTPIGKRQPLAPGNPVNDYAQLIELFLSVVQQGRPVNRARAVHENDITCSADRFDRTAKYLAADARQIGLDQVEVVPGVPGRGPGSGAWTQWERWTVRGATLHDADRGHKLADYNALPYILALFSTPTPPEGVTAPVVVCDDTAAIERGEVDVAGKLVLSRQGCRGLRPVALAKGAAGLLHDGGVGVDAEAVAWQKMGFGCWPPGERTFCFSISRRTGDGIRRRIAGGETVRLTAKVDTVFEPGGLPWVTAVLPGAHPEAGEVLMQAHAFEPGLIDNASGIGAVWEIAAVIREQIEMGRLPKPRRSLRILSMYECFGLADFAHQRPEIIARTVADVNVDTLGLAGSPLPIPRQPLFFPNFLDDEIDVFRRVAAGTSPLPWPERAFAYANDTFLADPLHGVPTVDIIAHDAAEGGYHADAYHNSRDDGGHLDAGIYADQIARIAALVYRLLSLDDETVKRRPGAVLPNVPAEGDAALKPGRTHTGVPMLENLPTLEHSARILATGVNPHALLWANGQRSLAQIAEGLAQEGHGASLEDLATYFKELESIGYCTL